MGDFLIVPRKMHFNKLPFKLCQMLKVRIQIWGKTENWNVFFYP